MTTATPSHNNGCIEGAVARVDGTVATAAVVLGAIRAPAAPTRAISGDLADSPGRFSKRRLSTVPLHAQVQDMHMEPTACHLINDQSRSLPTTVALTITGPPPAATGVPVAVATGPPKRPRLTVRTKEWAGRKRREVPRLSSQSSHRYMKHQHPAKEKAMPQEMSTQTQSGSLL